MDLLYCLCYEYLLIKTLIQFYNMIHPLYFSSMNIYLVGIRVRFDLFVLCNDEDNSSLVDSTSILNSFYVHFICVELHFGTMGFTYILTELLVHVT